MLSAKSALSFVSGLRMNGTILFRFKVRVSKYFCVFFTYLLKIKFIWCNLDCSCIYLLTSEKLLLR